MKVFLPSTYKKYKFIMYSVYLALLTSIFIVVYYFGWITNFKIYYGLVVLLVVLILPYIFYFSKIKANTYVYFADDKLIKFEIDRFLYSEQETQVAKKNILRYEISQNIIAKKLSMCQVLFSSGARNITFYVAEDEVELVEARLRSYIAEFLEKQEVVYEVE